LNASLKRKQFQVAMRGNPALLIWLGKQYLGQSDKLEGPGAGDDLAAVLREFLAGAKANPST
jgi:hypothetical protein